MKFNRSVSLFLLLFTSILLIPHPTLSQELFSKEIPVEVYSNALSHDKESDTYLAEGNVVLIQGRLKIEADKILFNKRQMKATATGHVVVTDERGSIARGETLDIDLETGMGSMDKGNLFYEPEHLYIKGTRLMRTGKETYKVKDGRFTTCDCLPPEWSFKSSDLKVTRGEYLTSKHTFFLIKDIPLLYSPYIRFPIKRDRQTGFLFPGFGFSDFKGASIYNAFFWAISRNRDATFYFDYEAERGYAKGVQYRYIRTRRSKGELFFYHYKEKDVNRIRKFRGLENNLSHPQNAKDDRWLFRFNHSESLPYGINIKADIAEVSDDEYFLDFYMDPDIKDPDDRSLKKLESNLTLSKSLGKFNLVAQFRYFDDLLKDSDKDTLQKLPQIDLTGSSINIPGTRLYFSLESSYIRFFRREGIDGNRIDIHPSLSWPIKPLGLFELTPRVGLRETQYWVNQGKRNRGRELYDLSLNLETTFVKVFSPVQKRKFKHTIRPQVTYSYIQDRDQSGLPSFDGVDRIQKENKVTYSVTSLVTGRKIVDGKRIYRDHLFFKLSQSYDINEATRVIGPDEKRRPFSLISGELNLFPYQRIGITSKADFDPYGRRFNKYITSLNLSDSRGDNMLLGYNYTRNSVNYIDLSLNLRLTGSLRAFHRSRFSHLNETTREREITTLETVYGLSYQSQCWGIEIERIERPDERIIMATVNLLGLGEIAKVKGKLPESERNP